MQEGCEVSSFLELNVDLLVVADLLTNENGRPLVVKICQLVDTDRKLWCNISITKVTGVR